MQSASHVHTWTASMQYSGTNSVATMLQRVGNCLIMYREPSAVVEHTGETTDCAVLQKKLPLRNKVNKQ